MSPGPLFGCLLAAAFFGASTPIAKYLLGDGALGPFTLAGLLYLGAALATAPFARGGGSPERRRATAHRRFLLASIVFGGLLGPVLLLFALRTAAAASISLWLNLEAVFTAALATLFFREHLGPRTWLAAAAVIAGGALLAAPTGTAGLTAAALTAAACLCWAIDNHATALIDGYTPAQTTLIKGAAAGTVNLALGLATEPFSASLTAVTLAVATGAFAYGASIALYIAGAQRLGATRAQLVFATAPLFGATLAWTALAEPITTAQLAAAPLMLAGVALVLRGHHEHAHSHESLTHTHAHRHDDDHHSHVHPGLPAWLRHTHEHTHEAVTHTHAHHPDLHHRHH
jgi:drug/metabolite transporter (DMT)-like permease